MGSIKLLVVFVIAFSVFCSFPSRTEADMNVLQIINASFPDLYRHVIQYPGLVSDLSNPSLTFTVFAPIDSAFNGTILPVNTSLPILSYHVASGAHRPATLAFGSYIRTLLFPHPLANYSQVLIVGKMGSSTTLNGVVVRDQPQNATNGIVYTIEGLLIPPSNYVVDIIMKNYTTLNALVSLSGLDLKLHPLTLFAPTDMAFSNLPSIVTKYLTLNNNLSRPDLTNVLLNHGVGVPVYTGDVNRGASKEFNTLLPGSGITLLKPVNFPNSSVMVLPNATIVNPDILAANGVVHGIDSVLVPVNFSFTLEKAIYALGATSYLQQVISLGLMSSLLNDTASRTLFVPTNAAIGNMSLSKDSLLYHAIANSFNESMLKNGYLLQSLLTLPSLSGRPQVLKFTTNSSTSETLVNGVAVHNRTTTLQTPMVNYVYLVDKVLSLPAPVETVLSNNIVFSSLYDAVKASSITSFQNDSLTVFAPTDDAFSELVPGTVGYLLNVNSSASRDLLVQVLESHILDDLPAVVYYSTLITTNTSFPTLSGNRVYVDKFGNGDVTVNGSAVVYPDILAANGVIHGINRVLIPASVSFSVQNLLEGIGNFSRLLYYLNETGLIHTLNNATNFTIFAPDDDAFESVSDLNSLTSNMTRLTEVLAAHVVFKNVTTLLTNETFTTASGQTIVVISSEEVELRDNKGETLGSAASVQTTTYGYNGYAYGINRVLGVEQASSSSSGLKTWEIVLIVIAGVVAALLLLAIIIAVVYFVYNAYYKNTGYRKIND